MPETGDEWDERRLCPDGACIGVLAASGVCTVCCKRGGEALAEGERGAVVAVAVEATPQVAATDDDGSSAEVDDDRELCPTGTCLGLIGPDRRCKECGASARS
jgi:hypothetical protein